MKKSSLSTILFIALSLSLSSCGLQRQVNISKDGNGTHVAGGVLHPNTGDQIMLNR